MLTRAVASSASAPARRAVTQLVALLVRATRRQARLVDALTTRVAALETQLDDLRTLYYELVDSTPGSPLLSRESSDRHSIHGYEE